MALFGILDIVDSASLLIVLGVILITFLIKYIVTKCQRDPRMVKLAKTLPGPPALPLVGNSLDFHYKGDSVKLAVEYNKKYGDTYRLWLGKYLAVTFCNIDDLETVFMNSKMLGKPKLFQPFEDFFGDGIFVTRSISKWKKNRKYFLPVLNRNAFPRYTSIINEKTEFVAKKMQELVDGPVFDAWDYMPNLAFDIILKSSMNVDLDWNDSLLLQYYSAAVEAIDLCFKKLLSPWLQHKVINYLLYKNKSTKARKTVEEFIRKLIADKKEEILSEIEVHKNNTVASPDGVPPKRFLTLAYELAELENDENIMLDELITILSGGTDPGLITSLFLLMVAMHPDIQDKLYDELYEIFGDSDRPADENEVERLPYLDQVLKETLRRFPVPVMFREAEEDIKIGDRIIPADTIVIVSNSAVHFNPEYYPDPWKFNPDHFSPENVEKRPKLAFLAFSAGPRMCIGYNFGMFEMKLTLSALLRKFTFHTTMKLEDVHMDNGLMMTSVNGYKLTVTSRVRKPSYLKK
ncbi:cytochrome P450 4C1-like [Planococcus citri]|uniref:cytochrome P450 4C1-like n=1 Tax=Planococcus citri TaxID=170843 RepID=UPI0031F96197